MATRESPGTTVPADVARERVEPESLRRVRMFDPELRDLVMLDPVAQAIQGAWRNRQQHGRIAYDQMMRHAAVAAPFRTLLAVIKSIRVSFVAPQQEPTKTQREMAEYLNAQLDRLSWTKVVDGWFGQGYQYGFNLAEISTRVEPWNGRPFVQLTALTPLPQGSLDDGFTLLDSGLPITSSSEPSAFRPTYTCFDFDERGTVTGYHQFRKYRDDKMSVNWTASHERLRILHFKNGGGDGNPFGESLLFPAFEHWADLYLLEKLEQIFLENATPYITASYAGDEPKPALHDLFAAYISEQDPSKRLLIGNNMTFGKVTASDPDFVAHIEKKKEELRNYITFALLMPNSVYRETGQKDLDTRNLVQMFLKFTLPSLLDEIAEVMTQQFGKRLVDANFSNVETKDYPRFKWRFITPNDLRLVQSLLQLALPHIQSDKLGEVLAEYLPGFEQEFIAKDPKDSVGVVRTAAITEAGALASAEGKPNDPPPKEPGSERERTDGETGNVGQETSTEA